MKFLFLPYTLDRNGRLRSFITLNNIDIQPFIINDSNSNEISSLEKILEDLNIDVDNERLLYLNNLKFSENLDDEENEYEVIALNLSSLNFKFFLDKWKLKENSSHLLSNVTNGLLLGCMMKLTIEKIRKEIVFED